MGQHPYTSLPAHAYWRAAIAERDVSEWGGLYTKKFDITPDAAIATAGSCFAQHIARHLRMRGFNYVDYEPAPPLLPVDMRKNYGYEIFSCRYGNIYTSRQLRQLVRRAFGRLTYDEVWVQDGRYYDPLRPTVEPNGFASRQELETARTAHLAAVKRMFKMSGVFVFTLGLTEVWTDRETGIAYPLCPGTVAGVFDPDRYVFTNLTFSDVLADMEAVIKLVRRYNENIKFLLTVSPVPLTATASGQHVMVATAYSKSVLRAVAGDLEQRYGFVDYFPSYELITTPAARGQFYRPNLREVTAHGVEQVMRHFFAAHGASGGTVVEDDGQKDRAVLEAIVRQVDVICDEETLDPGRA